MSGVTRIADGVAAAAWWRLLGLLLERPTMAWREEVRALAAEVADPQLRQAAALAGRATEGDYLRLLGPGGLVSPREAAYCGLGDPGWILSHLACAYAAFAYVPRAENPLDHVTLEAGFVGYLHLKEAMALADGDDESAAVTVEARDGFVAAHLVRLASGMARRLEGVDGGQVTAAVRALGRAVPVVTEDAPAMPDPLAGGCGSCPAG